MRLRDLYWAFFKRWAAKRRATISSRLHLLIFEVNPIHLSGISGTSALVWGLWVLFPSVTFNTRSFEVMATVAPEETWGVVYTCVGFAQMYAALAVNSWLLRALASLVTFFCWTFLAVLLAIGNPSTTGVPIYSLMALVSFASFARRWQDKGES
jgi:hypothetical protein